MKVVKNYYPDFIIRNPEVRRFSLSHQTRQLSCSFLPRGASRLATQKTEPRQVGLVGIQSGSLRVSIGRVGQLDLGPDVDLFTADSVQDKSLNAPPTFSLLLSPR